MNRRMTPLILPRGRNAPLVALAGALLMATAACGTNAQATPPSAPPPTPVGVAKVELREIHLSDELTGRVEAIHHVDIRPRVSGYVTRVAYREGAEVPAGALLFAIDPRPYDAALARANAEFAHAKARVELAKSDADRGERLLAASAIPRAERDTLASTAVQAEADVQAALAAVELARLDVEFTQVRAPIAGRTGVAAVSVGDFVAAGPQPTLLTTVVSIDPMYVYFTGDEQTYLRFASHANDAGVEIGLADEPGFPHAGKVDFIDNRVDAATGTIRVRAVVANADQRLTPGLYARVRLPEGAAVKAVLIDDKAIQTDQDRKFVYVLAANDTVERRDIKLGRIVDGLRVVESGVAAGDRVIISNLQKVFPGAKATVAAPAPASQP